MSLAGQVVAFLKSRNVPSAVIGGVALAVHGIARATLDLDVVVIAPKVLEPAFWDGVGEGITIEIRRCDAHDPLAGVVRCAASGAATDVVVGPFRWIDGALSRAVVREIAGEHLPVVTAADLVLLKLYAGGPQDLLDVRLLFAADPALRDVVRTHAASSPPTVATRLSDLETQAT